MMSRDGSYSTINARPSLSLVFEANTLDLVKFYSARSFCECSPSSSLEGCLWPRLLQPKHRHRERQAKVLPNIHDLLSLHRVFISALGYNGKMTVVKLDQFS